MQWKSDLIGYDALNSYGSPSYYAQKMFSKHQGDEVLAVTAQDLPSLHLDSKQPHPQRRAAARQDQRSQIGLLLGHTRYRLRQDHRQSREPRRRTAGRED